ncbi:MAG: hypothetical protein NWF07_17195, partial [Candidatus Bathyarchaeota archaeon]|nr:hypothetical protein [Candidatus Bathyarchaeota archaeon]
NLASNTSEIDRLEPELATVNNRLLASQSSAEKITALDEAENQAKEQKNQAKGKQKTGGIIAGIGVIFALLLMYLVNVYAALLGVLVIVYGGYTYTQNDPDKHDSELERVRDEKTKLIGEQTLLNEHQKTKESIEKQLGEAVKNQSNIHEAINTALNKLPDQPREYRTTVNINNSTTVETLRAQIQKDTETLTSLTTEKNSLQKKADSLESTEITLASIKQELETKNSEAEAIMKQITATEQETGITQDMETEVRQSYNDANKKLTQLTTQQKNHRDALLRQPQLQETITETSNEISLLEASQKQEEKQLKGLEKTGINLGDEPELNTERDQKLTLSARLTQEEQERNNDVEESRTIMEDTTELRDKYPVLAEESERETFRIEAMRRAQILLDTTREGIMAGVKQDVEKNMMQFLPTLTDNRYNRARIDETNYRIEVLDREAKTWKAKGVFSGATQDQFSLALRLAFAISTIPSSRGARPGFIFLDEPLSGFDAQRRTGFIELLRDDLSRYFDQIIVVSHIEALAEEFPQNITLDSGRIVQQ